MQRRFRTIALIVVVALALAVRAFAAGPAVRAELSARGVLTVGEPAELSVVVDGNDAEPPAVGVEGADVRYGGQIAETTVTNGHVRSKTRFAYTVVPRHAGALDIPAINVETAAGVAMTAPIHATVAAASTARSAPAAAADAAADESRRAFIEIKVPAKKLYVGQAVPVEIHAYFRSGVGATLQGPPTLGSDEFILSELPEQPTQTEVEIEGVPYVRAAWTGILSAAKPRTGKLGVELPVEITFRAPRQRLPRRSLSERFGGDPFADSFFGGADPFAELEEMFDVGAVQRRPVTLRAGTDDVTVIDVPVDGKPAGFTGAIGSFTLALDPPAADLHVGEPTTVTVRATGTGNFDRLALGGVPESADVKTYLGKTSFAAGTGKLMGTKTLAQTIVPTRTGALTVPALTLAYFDPAKRAYVTAATEPVTLHVAAAPAGTSASASAGSAELDSAPVREPSATSAPVDADQNTRATLRPLYRQPRFWALPSALAIVTTVLAGMGWRRRSPWLARRLGARRVDRIVARRSAEMERAAHRADAAGFFTAARQALQTRLGALWRIAPAAVTAADVDARLGNRGATIRSVFEHADQITYAGAATTAEPLDHWRSLVREQLAQLEAAR